MTLTPLDRRAVRVHFRRAAPGFEAAAVLYREIEDRLFERLDHFDVDADVVLDLGAGNARACAGLARRHPNALVLAVDESAAMLRRRKTGPAGNRPPLCADMHRLPLGDRSVDVAFSNLALPWSDDEAAVFAELRRVLRPGGLLAFSTLGPDSLQELRQAWGEVDDGPHVHDFSDLHDVGDTLVHAGFRDPVMDVERLQVRYDDPASLLRELKALGATNAARARFRGLTGKTAFGAVLAACERQLDDSGRFSVTLEVVFGAAMAPPEGQAIRTPGGEIATFSVESLKRRF